MRRRSVLVAFLLALAILAAAAADYDGDGYEDAEETGALLVDANLSGRVDGFDLAWMGREWGALSVIPVYDGEGDPILPFPPNPDFVFDLDFTRDGTIDGDDLALLAAYFGLEPEPIVPPPSDTTPPTAPASPVATPVSSSGIDLSWTASTDNVGVTGYRVERCAGASCTSFAQIGTAVATSYSDTGLASETTYRYRLRAADAAGNLSAYSSAAEATTEAGASGPTYYIRDGGTSGACTDWTNACDTLPDDLVRGAVYLLADGSYGSYAFDDPVDGVEVITVRKATEADHGTGVGWSSAYGDGQAVFTYWEFHSDYYSLDGRRRNPDWRQGATDEYGIRVASGGGTAARLDDGGSNFGDHLTFAYVDFSAGGRDTGYGDDVIYSNGWTGSGTGPRSVTFSRCAMHDSDRTIFLMRQWSDLLVEHSYLARNASDPVNHGEIVSDDGSDDVTWRFNVIEDPEGTAVWAILNGDGGEIGDASNWRIYGNTILHGAEYDREGISGLVFCAHDASNDNRCSDWRVYNNTIYGIEGLWSGFVFQEGTGNLVSNNVWHSCVNSNNGGADFDYNWYYDTPAGADDGAHSITCTSGCDLFVDAAERNFDLAVGTPAGATLSAPYDVDPDGVLRGSDGTWDRGAFEHTSSMASSITQYGITWTFDAEHECGQFANGDYWVVGPVTITSITPDTEGGRNGWEVNPESHDYQPYDDRAYDYSAALMPALPLTVEPTSSVVKAVSAEVPEPHAYLQTAAVLTVVPAAPPNGGAGVFRPPYYGPSTSKTTYYTVDEMNLGLLPSLDPVADAPALDTVAGWFQRVQLDHKENWTGRNIHPIDNMPDYGAAIAQRTDIAALRLMLDDPESAKRGAAIRYIQAGLDFYQMLVNGMTWPANGGHDLGRKLPILFAGLVLENQAILDAVSDAPLTTFHEDGQIEYFPQGDGGNGVVVWGQPNSEYQYWYEAAHPNTGSKVARDPYGYIDGGYDPGESYQYIVSLDFKYAALAARLLPGGEAAWDNPHFFAYVDRWVSHGTWTQPDPCAPPDLLDWGNYGITFGPDGSGGCILDTNPVDGIGRFPANDATNADSGQYDSAFEANMWNAYHPGS